MRLDITNPCTQRWEHLTPQVLGRYCQHCSRLVHDVSALTQKDLVDLFKSDGAVCVRVLKRLDGSIVTRGDTESRLSPGKEKKSPPNPDQDRPEENEPSDDEPDDLVVTVGEAEPPFDYDSLSRASHRP